MICYYNIISTRV